MRKTSPDTPAYGMVILAAGKSSRMGRPKLLLSWGRTTILGHLIALWRTLHVSQIAVVLDPEAVEVSRELDRLEFPSNDRIGNPQADRGMFSSIRCAAVWPGWNPFLTHFIIALGDQPQLRQETLQSLLKFSAANPAKICQPRFNRRNRHPILLPTSTFRQIQDDPAHDMKEFLSGNAERCEAFESEDPGLEWDMDTPEDYERMLAHYFPEK